MLSSLRVEWKEGKKILTGLSLLLSPSSLSCVLVYGRKKEREREKRERERKKERERERESERGSDLYQPRPTKPTLFAG